MFCFIWRSFWFWFWFTVHVKLMVTGVFSFLTLSPSLFQISIPKYLPRVRLTLRLLELVPARISKHIKTDSLVPEWVADFNSVILGECRPMTDVVLVSQKQINLKFLCLWSVVFSFLVNYKFKLKILSWNMRGLNHRQKRIELKQTMLIDRKVKH